MASFFYRTRFTWDHRWTQGHASSYVDGELRSAQRVRLERHVEACADCRQLVASLRQMLRALDRLPPPSGDPQPNRVAASVQRRLREPPSSG